MSSTRNLIAINPNAVQIILVSALITCFASLIIHAPSNAANPSFASRFKALARSNRMISAGLAVLFIAVIGPWIASQFNIWIVHVPASKLTLISPLRWFVFRVDIIAWLAICSITALVVDVGKLLGMDS